MSNEDRRLEDSGNGRRKRDNPGLFKEYVWYAIVALLAGSGGAGVRDLVHDPRPYPYTSIDAEKDFATRDVQLRHLHGSMHQLEDEHRVLSNTITVLETFMKRYHPDYEPILRQFNEQKAYIPPQ